MTLSGREGIQGMHLLVHWILLACREAWVNEVFVLGHVGAWEFIEGVQQILRELEMRQAIYAPVFESPDRAPFSSRVKAKLLQSSPSTCCGA